MANYVTGEHRKPELLIVTELGGYPDFSSIYHKAGFNCTQIHTVRKAIRELKKRQPAVNEALLGFGLVIINPIFGIAPAVWNR